MNFICYCVLLLHGLLNVRLTNNVETIFICYFLLRTLFIFCFFDFLKVGMECNEESFRRN
jgi:hypothetical protein